MIEEQGTVTATDGERVLVSSFAPQSCGVCHGSSACGTATLARLFRRRQRALPALNRAGAKPGDRVIVGLNENALLRAAWIAYALPLAGLLAGALLGQSVASSTLAEPFALLTSLIGLITGLWLAWRTSLQMAKDERYQAIVLRVVTTTDPMPLSSPVRMILGDGVSTEK